MKSAKFTFLGILIIRYALLACRSRDEPFSSHFLGISGDWGGMDNFKGD